MHSKLKIVAVIGVILLFVIGVGAYTWLTRPVLLEVYPADGATDIPVTAQIRMVFSRRMEPEAVIQHVTITPAVEGSFSWEGDTLLFTPAQLLGNQQEFTIHLKAGAAAASWLALRAQEKSWAFITGGVSLAYLWPAEGPADLYILSPDSGKVLRYTHGVGVQEYTSSRDGLTIYFSAGNAKGGSDLYKIKRIDAIGSPIKLLDCGAAQCRSPAVSYDESYLAYEYLLPDLSGGLAPAQVWLMNLASHTTRPVSQGTHESVQPAWSSKGWVAYYDRTNAAYVALNPQTNEQVELPNQTGQPGAWSPGGEAYLAPEINYFRSAGSPETGTSHLILYNLGTGKSTDLSGSNDVEDVEGNYSPDGHRIAFARKFLDAQNWSFGRQLWMMNADGADSQPITEAGDYNHYDIAWSLDGLRLAYVRFNQAKLSDPPELWMVQADGSNPIQLVIGGYSPLWIP